MRRNGRDAPIPAVGGGDRAGGLDPIRKLDIGSKKILQHTKASLRSLLPEIGGSVLTFIRPDRLRARMAPPRPLVLLAAVVVIWPQFE
jgi:hypothetical protein